MSEKFTVKVEIEGPYMPSEKAKKVLKALVKETVKRNLEALGALDSKKEK